MSTSRQTIDLFWQHAKRYPRYIIGLGFVIPATVLIDNFLKPYIVAQVLGQISRGAYNPHDLWASFGASILLYIPVAIYSHVIGWRLAMMLTWKLELLTLRDLSEKLFGHLMSQSADFHANRFSGSLVSQNNKFLGGYVRFADTTIFNLSSLVLTLGFTIAFLAPRAPQFVAILVVLVIAYVIGNFFMSKHVQASNTKEAQIQSKQTGYLADSISNVMAIKGFAAEKTELKRFMKAANDSRNAGLNVMKYTLRRDAYASSVNALLNISSVVIAVIGVKFFKADITTLFLIVTYTAQLGVKLWDFNSMLRNYNRAFGDSADMTEILQIAPQIQDLAEPETVRIQKGSIHFKAVTFTHPEAGDSLFNKISLDIKPGEKIGLVGHSGSGKTTLTKLLLRFSDIDDGEILIDGQNIAHITQDDLRRHIAYVPQEPLLFHRSIRENISYGKPGATDEEIADAARKANAAEFIEKLPKGYDTLVGERGVKLSGGQRQRIAIARAILKDAPILVLDEATSALDSESERLIQASLRELMKNRTAIVIAHRLSTVQKMDRIVVLEDGAIVEQASHKELIEREGGVYARLWAHQSGGFIEE